MIQKVAGSNLGRSAHIYLPPSPSSIIWYQPMGSDTLRLERQPQAWRKVMLAYCRVDSLK